MVPSNPFQATEQLELFNQLYSIRIKGVVNNGKLCDQSTQLKVIRLVFVISSVIRI